MKIKLSGTMQTPRIIIAIVTTLFLSSCGESTIGTSNDAKIKESCPLIEEAWKTYLNNELDSNTSEVLQASWYLINEDLKGLATDDENITKYIDGVEDALNGEYSTTDFKSVLAVCGISYVEKP